jgi:hypothetical protein
MAKLRLPTGNTIAPKNNNCSFLEQLCKQGATPQNWPDHPSGYVMIN